MSKHLHPPTHLPHPHIAEHLAELWRTAVRQQSPIVPDGHDWDDWHWYEGGVR